MPENANTYSRREILKFLSYGFLSAFSANTSGCAKPTEATPATTPPIYGPLEKPSLLEQRETNKQYFPSFKDKPLMTEANFEHITGSMQNSSSLLINKLGNDISVFWNATENPPNTPSWISEISTPFIITYDRDELSYSRPEIQFGNQNLFILVAPDPDNKENKKEATYPTFNPVKVAIHLGSPQFSRNEGSLVEGCYLAKEWINTTALVAIAHRFVDYFRLIRVEFLSAEDRQPIINRWVASRSIYPPDDFLDLMFNSKVSALIIELQKKILVSKAAGSEIFLNV